ncbi:hypothetical protein SGPA1_10304 [Streptomyces misionensis JCM 4497]
MRRRADPRRGGGRAATARPRPGRGGPLSDGARLLRRPGRRGGRLRHLTAARRTRVGHAAGAAPLRRRGTPDRGARAADRAVRLALRTSAPGQARRGRRSGNTPGGRGRNPRPSRRCRCRHGR